MDEEFTKGALGFMEKAKKDNKPFFLWWNSTRMHIFTHLKPESEGKTGFGPYPDGMVEHDAMVGQLLDKLKELGIEDNTIVMYSTDNGAEEFSWPDGGTTPFRGEKATNWEGGYRVPTAIRWPGVIKPGTVYNDLFSHEDMLPTLLAAGGDANVKQKLLTGMKVGDKSFKVHLDGYNLMPFFKGEVKEQIRAGNSSISMMTGPSSHFVTRNGRSSSPSNEQKALECGRSRSWFYASPRSSTCAPIPSKRVTMYRNGLRSLANRFAPSCWCLRRNMSAHSWRRSRNSRQARRWAASASIK